MQRFKRGEHFPYEHERISSDLEAIRVFTDHATYRVLFATEGRNTMVFLALHVFQKTDRKLPKRDRKLAERRLKDWRGRGNT